MFTLATTAFALASSCCRKRLNRGWESLQRLSAWENIRIGAYIYSNLKDSPGVGLDEAPLSLQNLQMDHDAAVCGGKRVACVGLWHQ